MSCWRQGERASPWRSLLDSPLLFAAWAAVVLGCVAVLDVGRALHRAETVRRDAVPELARLAAETALARAFAAGPLPTRSASDVGGVQVTIERQAPDTLAIVCDVAGEGTFHYRCAEIPGAAPAAFARAGVAVDPSSARVVAGARLIPTADVPQLDPVQLDAAVRGERLAAFRTDQGVALLALQGGTDKPDFVFDSRHTADLAVAGGLVVLPGNLWIEPGDRPLRLPLARDLVLVVQGNVYVGRSVIVDGPGRLVVVAARGAGEASFADLDGNGRWSAGDALRGVAAFIGPSEGGGNTYLGLPGSRTNVACECGFVVAGELHVAGAASVAGPLVLAHGATPIAAVGARVEARGIWRFDVERERLPGFVVSGGPRPGRLERVPPPGRAGEQTLYLSAPAR